ncbi:MAG: hypothetical protein PHH59_16105 [Methylovulum sp.]|uniref:hypothetical protein n=1 Tax=Methylovulum sp. TaxID=1916980 RepID=UPI002605BC24|nr:hypothetical protein [Methylovulum sp.]MDD2725530.1 hypothetical protein [Methylovulum sp.]MDD5126140.1 hypothetical protein [Methylovulum sp.]
MNNKNRKFWLVLLTVALVLAGIVAQSETVSANVLPSAGTLALIKSTCPSGPNQYQEFTRLKTEIAAADTIDQARALALAPTDSAIGALKNARTMMPFSNDLRSAETRLNDVRSHILVASSQEQVADQFDGMMLAGLDNDHAAHVKVGSGACDYSSGELIAIVIGLVLGIIPGLILMVVLC